MKTLKQLVEEYGATGFVLVSSRNGDTASIWIDWDDDHEKEYGNIQLHKIKTTLQFLCYKKLMDEAVEYDSKPIYA